MFQQLQEELAQLPSTLPTEDLSPSGLLQFPPAISGMLLWMMRSRSVNAAMAAAYLGQNEANAVKLLENLVQRGLVEILSIEPEKQYRVRIQTPRRGKTPGKIWEALDE